MKNKFLVIAAVLMLMFSVAGQAMAAFTTGDLIQVVYVAGGTGNEVGTDFGSATSWTSADSVTGSSTASSISLSNFTGSSMSDLNVAYFVKNSSNGFWVTGPVVGGQTNANGKKNGTGTFMTQVTSLYATNAGGTSQAVITSSTANSYWRALDMNGTGVGSFAGFANGGSANEANLAALASGGYVDQYLYYYPSSTSNLAGSGVAVATIRTYADHVEVIPISSVPVPAAVWLLGSGLIGLVGIRRRETEA